jgi:hypothetical protein
MMGVLAAVEGGEGDDELVCCCWRRSDVVWRPSTHVVVSSHTSQERSHGIGSEKDKVVLLSTLKLKLLSGVERSGGLLFHELHLPMSRNLNAFLSGL